MKTVALIMACLLLSAASAAAQGLQRVPVCGRGAPPQGLSPGSQDTSGNTCVTSAPAQNTWQATMALSAATSTSLIDANVVKAPNSAATPASFTALIVINTGSNVVYVCQFGGTCSASAGGEAIQPGGGADSFNLSPASVPTFYSTAGTTLSLRNGS